VVESIELPADGDRPRRFAFYVDVGNQSASEAATFLKRAKAELGKKRLVDPRTGRIDMRFNPLKE